MYKRLSYLQFGLGNVQGELFLPVRTRELRTKVPAKVPLGDRNEIQLA